MFDTFQQRISNHSFVNCNEQLSLREEVNSIRKCWMEITRVYNADWETKLEIFLMQQLKLCRHWQLPTYAKYLTSASIDVMLLKNRTTPLLVMQHNFTSPGNKLGVEFFTEQQLNYVNISRLLYRYCIMIVFKTSSEVS